MCAHVYPVRLFSARRGMSMRMRSFCFLFTSLAAHTYVFVAAACGNRRSPRAYPRATTRRSCRLIRGILLSIFSLCLALFIFSRIVLSDFSRALSPAALRLCNPSALSAVKCVLNLPLIFQKYPSAHNSGSHMPNDPYSGDSIALIMLLLYSSWHRALDTPVCAASSCLQGIWNGRARTSVKICR